MIVHLKGNIIEINPTNMIIECFGIGYDVAISLNTYSKFQDKKEVTIYTKLIIREDAHLLFGFHDKTEKQMFNLLISVNGVGPSSALIMLSSLQVPEIIDAINKSQNLILQKVKGIGSKTAQRIIIDLKDKINNFETNSDVNSFNNNIKTETLNALEVLGVPKRNVEKHIDILLQNKPESTIEELIKEILKRL